MVDTPDLGISLTKTFYSVAGVEKAQKAFEQICVVDFAEGPNAIEITLAPLNKSEHERCTREFLNYALRASVSDRLR